MRLPSLFLICAASVVASPILEVVTPTDPVVGSTFNISVEGTGFTDLYAYQFDLVLSSNFEIISVSEGPLLPSLGSTYFIPGTISADDHSVTDVADTLIGPPPADGPESGLLMTIEVQAVTLGPASAQLQNSLTLDSNYNDLAATTQNATFAVTAPEPGTLTEFLTAGLIGLSIMAHRRRKVVVGTNPN